MGPFAVVVIQLSRIVHFRGSHSARLRRALQSTPAQNQSQALFFISFDLIPRSLSLASRSVPHRQDRGKLHDRPLPVKQKRRPLTAFLRPPCSSNSAPRWRVTTVCGLPSLTPPSATGLRSLPRCRCRGERIEVLRIPFSSAVQLFTVGSRSPNEGISFMQKSRT